VFERKVLLLLVFFFLFFFSLSPFRIGIFGVEEVSVGRRKKGGGKID
jgi:hypothetical protein